MKDFSLNEFVLTMTHHYLYLVQCNLCFARVGFVPKTAKFF